MVVVMMYIEYELITGFTSFNKCTDFCHNMEPVSKMTDVQNALQKNMPICKSSFNTTKKEHLNRTASPKRSQLCMVIISEHGFKAIHF